jgi:RNA polymerase II subunit A small phosphatase-like protein
MLPDRLNNGRKLLILDLDETLIHSSYYKLVRECDIKVFDFYVYKREHLDDFLKECFDLFDVAVWSSGSDDYVPLILKQLVNDISLFKFIWGRSKCTQKYSSEWLGYSNYLKNIKKVKDKGYKLENIIVVDDSYEKWEKSYGNLVLVEPYYGEPKDKELFYLIQYLRKLKDEPNIRAVEKRGWRYKILEESVLSK